MKRILFGTSALGLTLATFGMPASSVMAGCSFGSNAYICDSTSSGGEDLSGAGNAAIINFVQNPINLTLTGSDYDDVATVGGEVDGDPNSFGELGFSGLFMGNGNDTIGIGGSIELATGAQGEPGKIVNSQVEMEDGDDQLIVGGVIQNDQYNTVNTGDGNDTIAINAGGSIVSSIFAGDGEDMLINDGTIGGRVEMGAGNDRVQTSSSFNGIVFMGDGDDVLHAIDKAPQQGSYNGPVTSGYTMLGDDGFDTLILDGVSNGANLNIAEVDSFEQLIKQGSGSWVMQPNGAVNNTAFTDGVFINDGMINFLNTSLQTYVYNQGTMTGHLTLSAAAQAAAGDPVPFYNASAGTVAGNINFTGFDDTFVNEGRISNLHVDGVTPVEIDMGAGSDTFQNSGSVSGHINLGADSDRFVLTDDTLFNISPPGMIDGGIDFDYIELAGTGGRLSEVNSASSAIRNFEHLDVTNGVWALSADQDFTGDVRITGGELNVNTALTGKELVVDGGILNLAGSYQGLSTTVTSGSLNLMNGLLTTPVTVGPNGDLHGNGRVAGNIFVDGMITPDMYDGVGTLVVDGNLEVSDTGTVVINVDPATGRSDEFDVTGFVTIDDGALIEVVPISDIDPGEQYVFDISQSGLIDGTFTQSGAFQDYAIQYGDDGLISLVMGDGWGSVGTTGTLGSTNNFGYGLNQNQIWAYLNAVNASGGGFADAGLANLWNGYWGAGFTATTAQQQAVLDSLSSEFYSAGYLQSRSYANYVRNKMVDRLDDKEWCATMQGAGEANCRAYRSDAGDLWGSLEVLAQSDSSSSVSDFSGTTIAGLIGMDRRLGLITTGLVGGLGFSSADVNTKGTSAGLNASLGGYFSLPMEVLNIDGDIAYNYGSAEGKRAFSIAPTTSTAGAYAGVTGAAFTGQSTTHQVGGGIRLTQEYKNEFGLEMQPEIGLSANYMMMPGFTETGTPGGLALRMADSSHFDADATLGVHVRRPMRTANATLIPEARVKVSKKLVGQTMTTQAHLIGGNNAEVADFNIDTQLPNVVWNLGVGVNYEMDSGLMLFGDYDYRGSSDATEHQGSLGLRYDF